MFDVLKQSVLSSIALASVTRDKIDEVVEEVRSRAQLSEQEVDEFRAEVDRRRDEAAAVLEQQIDQQIDHAFIQLGIVKAGANKLSEEASGALRQFIDERVDAALSQARIARTEEIEALVKRVELLEKKS